VPQGIAIRLPQSGVAKVYNREVILRKNQRRRCQVLRISCLRVGILCLATNICGHRCRPSEGVPNIVRFVRSGRRMASALASGPLME
jgi:hypothetical protein